MGESRRKEKLVMPSDESAFKQTLLKDYGDLVASYSGQGVLKLDGGQEVRCGFEAGQLRAGDVLLLCSFNFSFPKDFPNYLSDWLWSGPGAFRFEGITPEGYRVTADAPIMPIRYIPRGRFGSEPEITASRVFRLREMYVQMTEHPMQVNSARFGVTNFMFTGTMAHQTGALHHLVLPLSLKSADSEAKVIVSPMRQYNTIISRIQTLKTIDVTCEVVCEVPETKGIESLKEIVNDLCYLLSVARGTKIQWIYCDQYNGSGECIMRTHSSRITKPYSPSSIIDPRADGRHETKIFLEQAYSAYVSKRDSYRLDKGTIDAYLDAKAEQDFLEMRGAKLAVAMEMLKMVFLELPDSPAKEYVLKEEQFKNLLGPIGSVIDQVLKDEGIDEKSRTALCNHGKIQSLNRRSFKYVMDILCKNIGLEVEKNDLALFIECRNKLVHSGQFYCAAATKEEREQCPPLPSKAHEYFFLVNFLDRIFLKLLGYSGVYIDWRVPGEPSRIEQV
jgi:hypothetical protein